MEERRLLDVREAAIYLSMSESTLYKRIANGEIAATRFGRSIRLDIRVLDEYIEANTRNNDAGDSLQ